VASRRISLANTLAVRSGLAIAENSPFPFMSAAIAAMVLVLPHTIYFFLVDHVDEKNKINYVFVLTTLTQY
jgi:hypothetical protein